MRLGIEAPGTMGILLHSSLRVQNSTYCDSSTSKSLFFKNLIDHENRRNFYSPPSLLPLHLPPPPVESLFSSCNCCILLLLKWFLCIISLIIWLLRCQLPTLAIVDASYSYCSYYCIVYFLRLFLHHHHPSRQLFCCLFGPSVSSHGSCCLILLAWLLLCHLPPHPLVVGISDFYSFCSCYCVFFLS